MFVVSKNLRVPGRGERIRFVVTAIVLIEAERSAIAKLGPALADVPGVAEAYSVTGEFDFVAVPPGKNKQKKAGGGAPPPSPGPRGGQNPPPRHLHGLF